MPRSLQRLARTTSIDVEIVAGAIAGDAFDATTILIDEAVKRIRSDLRTENAVRREHGEPPLPSPWCMWGITPFKADSRMTQSLSRRSFVFLEVCSPRPSPLICIPC